MLSRPGQIVRRADPDRFFATLFAPDARQPALFALYAFNHELARAREAAREPMLARIRLQWWREAVEGEARPHEVATPLRHAIAQGWLHAPDLLALIEAREQEIDSVPDSVEHWLDWLRLGQGGLAVAAGRVLGAGEPYLARLRDLGAGYGVAGVLGNLAASARQDICLLPADILAAHALTRARVIAAPLGPAMLAVRRDLASIGLDLLGSPRSVPPGGLAAGLVSVFARRDLRRPDRVPGPRGLGDKAAILAAVLTSRL